MDRCGCAEKLRLSPARHDILIVGAGLVGLTFACALRSSPWDIGIVEASDRDEGPLDETLDIRVSAITRASERIFAALGAWEHMEQQRVTTLRQMYVWDARGSGSIRFDSADIGEDRLGTIVENQVMQRALVECLSSSERLTWYRPQRLTALEVKDDHVEVTVDSGSTVQSRLVVGADGADSPVRLLAGIRTRGWRYPQHALVANVRTSEPHRESAWQVFLPTGPLALLPLPDQHSAVVWSTTSEEAQRLQSLDRDAFLAELQVAFGTRLGRMVGVGPRATFPLRLLHALEYVRPRLALVGDAAHTIHPLAGQGVNLGFLDAAVLAEVLLDSSGRRGDPGSFLPLRRYERWRKGDNMLMLAAMEGFHRLFGARALPVRELRNRGLLLVDGAGPIKNLIMRYASGIEGDLPRLARSALSG
jgi:2-polyprenylphenol 6-hydroxylase